MLCKNLNASPKLYGPTDKIFNHSTGVSKKPQRRGRYDNHHGNICRIHCIGYICDLIKPPQVKINWDKVFKNNGTTFSDKHWLTDLGKVTIRLISTRSVSKIVFWLPEKYLDKNQLNHWKDIESRYIQIFYNEFQKRYDCKLGEIKRYQKPEYAIPADYEFLFLADKYNVKYDNTWIDESEGSPEWETNEFELAKAKLELPERLMRLETNTERMMEFLESITNVPRHIKILELRVGIIEKSLVKIEDGINRIEKLFSPPNNVNNSEGLYQ